MREGGRDLDVGVGGLCVTPLVLILDGEMRHHIQRGGREERGEGRKKGGREERREGGKIET